MLSNVQRIVSGGQTGVDRAALDFAIEHGLAIGGMIPSDRWAEDGPISKHYKGLVECDSPEPAVRTRLNVDRSDATLVISHGKLSGGSALTVRIARELKKPRLHIDLGRHSHDAACERVRLWLNGHSIHVLNVGGPRASKDPKIYDDALELLRAVFGAS